MRTSRHIAFVRTLVVMLSLVPAAVTAVAAQNRLAEATEATCTFSLVATGTWD